MCNMQISISSPAMVNRGNIVVWLGFRGLFVGWTSGNIGQTEVKLHVSGKEHHKTSATWLSYNTNNLERQIKNQSILLKLHSLEHGR